MKKLFTLAIVGGLIYLGATVNLGKRTFFGHVANIWRSNEAQELKDDVSPVIDRAKDRIEGMLDPKAPAKQPAPAAPSAPGETVPATGSGDTGVVGIEPQSDAVKDDAGGTQTSTKAEPVATGKVTPAASSRGNAAAAQ